MSVMLLHPLQLSFPMIKRAGEHLKGKPSVKF
jgi:hypothetical protein